MLLIFLARISRFSEKAGEFKMFQIVSVDAIVEKEGSRNAKIASTGAVLVLDLEF